MRCDNNIISPNNHASRKGARGQLYIICIMPLPYSRLFIPKIWGILIVPAFATQMSLLCCSLLRIKLHVWSMPCQLFLLLTPSEACHLYSYCNNTCMHQLRLIPVWLHDIILILCLCIRCFHMYIKHVSIQISCRYNNKFQHIILFIIGNVASQHDWVIYDDNYDYVMLMSLSLSPLLCQP